MTNLQIGLAVFVVAAIIAAIIFATIATRAGRTRNNNSPPAGHGGALVLAPATPPATVPAVAAVTTTTPPAGVTTPAGTTTLASPGTTTPTAGTGTNGWFTRANLGWGILILAILVLGFLAFVYWAEIWTRIQSWRTVDTGESKNIIKVPPPRDETGGEPGFTWPTAEEVSDNIKDIFAAVFGWILELLWGLWIALPPLMLVIMLIALLILAGARWGRYGVAGVATLVVFLFAFGLVPQFQGGNIRLFPQRASGVAPAILAKCDSLKRPFTFRPEWQEIGNSGGNCSGDLYYDESDVTLYVKRAGSDEELGPFHKGDQLPDDTECIWSETTFDGYIALVPSRYG